MRYHLARARADAPQRGEEAEVDDAERDAAPHLAAAFQPAPSTIDALRSGDPSHYKRELATWRGEGEATEPKPAGIATRGIGGAGAPLPYLQQIQKHFGAHDVTNVRAHAGEEAATASQQLGARAFAVGDNVAFAGEPDLHTAAHEAAHVVQQRAGVNDGDEAERHADEVADAVVAGDSAAPLLGSFAGTGRDAAPVVQRKPASAPTRSSVQRSSSTPKYVEVHRVRILTAIADRIAHTQVSQPHPLLRWTSSDQAPQLVNGAIREYVDQVPEQTLKQLMKLCVTSDLGTVIDEARVAQGDMDWIPAVGIAVGIAFDEALHTSIVRIGPRVRALIDRDGALPLASVVVASCPLDGVIAELLVTPGNVVFQPGKQTAGGRPEARKGVTETREVTYEWMGKHDPNLWHWIKVTAPHDATVNDVARTPLAGGEVLDRSEQAYRIAANPPYYGIPLETARLVPEAVAFAPAHVRQQLDKGDVGPRVATSGAFLESQLSDETALAGAPAPSASDPKVERTIPRIQDQLAFMRSRLDPWNASEPLLGATRFADRRRSEIAGDPRKGTQWQSALAAQERLLHDASGELAEFLDNLIAQGATPKDAAALGPVVRVLEAFAKAAGASSQHGAGMVALAEACKLRAMLSLSFVDEQVGRARAATGGDPSADVSNGPVTKPDDPEATATKPDLATRAADLRLAVMRGQGIDPDAVAMVGVDADETTVRARISGIRAQLAVINGMADDVGLTKAAYEHGMPTIRTFGDVLGKRTEGWLATLKKATTIDDRRNAIRDVESGMKAFDSIDNVEGKPGAIGRWAAWAQENVENERLHRAMVSLAIQLGVMIVTGQMVGAALSGARAAWLGASLATELRGAGLAYKAAEILLHAGSATLGQGLISGEYVGGADIAVNAVAMVLANAAMKPLQNLLHGDAVLEKQIETWAQLGVKTGKIAVEIGLETGIGIATSHLAHKAVKGGWHDAMDDSQEWIEQGISIGASRFVAVRMQKMRDRAAQAKAEAAAAHPGGSTEQTAFENLEGKADALARRAKKPASVDEARALLVESRVLLLEEKPLQQARAAVAGGKHPDPKALVARAGNEAELSGLGPEFADVPFQLAHLAPVVDGHVYEGSAAEISLAFETADRTLRSKPVRVLDPETGVWHVAIEGRVITVRDRDRAAKAARAKTVAVGKSRGARPSESIEPAEESRPTKPPSDDATTRRTHDEEGAKRARAGESPEPDAEAPSRVVLSGDDGEVRAAADRVKPKPGYIDVIVHGDANSFLVIREHVDVEIDHRALATYIGKRGLTGQKIRLIACESGLTPFAVAQHLSNKLDVEVLAPTRTAWIDGDGNVGVGRRDRNEGSWHPFSPKKVASDGTKARMRIPEQPHVPVDPAAPEHVPPLDVRFDHRERYSAANHDELQAKLGKMLEVDPRMTDGVRVEVERRKGVFGADYEVKRVAVGRGALAHDILAHADLVRLIEKYNGLVGKLHKVWDRLHGGAGKQFEGSRYPHGSRGWVLAHEIEKIGNHIATTQLMRDHGQLDASQASQEIAFLAGADTYFRDQLRTLAPGEQDPLLDISRPDVGETTRQAEAAGYKRPGQPGATVDGMMLDPEAYYYRRSESDPQAFELARKPGVSAPQLRARVVGGKFTGIELPVERPALKLSEITSGKELETLYAPEGSMAPYAEMIERAGLASRAVIDGAALSFHRRMSQKSNATIDDWRHAVKEHFRDRVLDKLADPALDAAASYQQMRKMVDGLGSSDRGSLVEEWYRARYAPNARDRQKYEITRTSGGNTGKIEKRVTDLIVGREIREVKDIEGPIDHEQFGAYADLLCDDMLRETMAVDKLRYVFTKPKGAIANLEFLADQMGNIDLRSRLSVEVLDASGRRHEKHTKTDVLALLATLRSGQ